MEFLQKLKVRMLSASLIVVLIAAIFWFNGWALTIFSALLVLLMAYEWVKMCQIRRQKILFLIVPLMWTAFYLAALGRYKMGFGIIFFFASFGIILSWFAWHRRFLWGGIAILYIGLPMVCLHTMLHAAENALSILIWTIVVVSSSDIGGYIFGNIFKGPKLLPSISPKKTWSGLGGSLVFSLGFGAFTYTTLTAHSQPFYFYMATLALSLIAILGDLFESFVKRKHNVKDTSGLIPGHGGVLDRVDGFLFVLPIVTWLCVGAPQMFEKFPTDYIDWKNACQLDSSTLVSNK